VSASGTLCNSSNTNRLQSYDDATTFKAKIDYANKMGLSGLMVWAIDQDDSDLSALTAVTGGTSKRQSTGGDFDLVDLDRLFPKEYIPADTSGTEYGLVTFGPGSESGELDPTNSGFGFLIAVGDSHGFTQLKKRSGRPDPFIFLDCPEHVLGQPTDEPQKARVVCISKDVEGCFRVMERGVEGTMVEMPDDCAPNSFARAISLELAKGKFQFQFYCPCLQEHY
jgi:chitinase